MCGIFALLNVSSINTAISQQFMKGKNRGPETYNLQMLPHNVVFGFHRLAINGLDEISNQPFFINGIYLVCNGEIFNYKYLYNLVENIPKSNSDCEIIIYLYLQYGIEKTLHLLDGEFAFVLYDSRNNQIYTARDPYGIRPLYMYTDKNHFIAFASEIKTLSHLFTTLNSSRVLNEQSCYSIQHCLPKTYSTFHFSQQWSKVILNKVYYELDFSPFRTVHRMNIYTNEYLNEDKIYSQIALHLRLAVIKRCSTTERPIACLLSGGLDSSLITALTSSYYYNSGKHIDLETYSIGLQNSTDLKHARIVADYLKTKHTEVIVTEDEMFNAIQEVIYAIESYDTTTVRASIGNYLVSKYISQHSQAKVILNGDGSDELFGGYLYMHKCPNDEEFDRETHRLLNEIYLYDVLRSDKSISSNGLEPRTPFLDVTFVKYILSLQSYFRNHNNRKQMEKFILRNSFTQKYISHADGRQMLPDAILWRTKEAFSDGVSSVDRSLFQILQERIAEKMSFLKNKEYAPCIETEQEYYRDIFQQYFPHCDNIIPKYWMPKYMDSSQKDPSARTLSLYNSLQL